MEEISVVQCRDCTILCYEKDQPIASCKPCRCASIGSTSNFKIIFDFRLIENRQSDRSLISIALVYIISFDLYDNIHHFSDMNDILLKKTNKSFINTHQQKYCLCINSHYRSSSGR